MENIETTPAFANPLNQDCPSRRFVELVADKWTMLTLFALRGGARRNGELRRAIGGISQKMLTQTLRQLSANGLVVRHDFATVPPHVEYELSDLGHSLNAIMESFDHWFAARLSEFDSAAPSLSITERS